ncbi:MAG TPA: acyl carrier protein [Pseudonocardiaceae bacterium]
MSVTHDVKRYVIENFAPDVSFDELENDYDLLENGVIDSLGLLRLISWLGERFSIPVEEMDLEPANFRSIDEICAFVDSARKVTT